MTLMEQVSRDIADAMRARDQGRLGALRMAKAALMNAEVQRGRTLTDVESQRVFASLIKQRRDSIEQFRAGGVLAAIDHACQQLQREGCGGAEAVAVSLRR